MCSLTPSINQLWVKTIPGFSPNSNILARNMLTINQVQYSADWFVYFAVIHVLVDDEVFPTAVARMWRNLNTLRHRIRIHCLTEFPIFLLWNVCSLGSYQSSLIVCACHVYNSNCAWMLSFFRSSNHACIYITRGSSIDTPRWLITPWFHWYAARRVSPLDVYIARYYDVDWNLTSRSWCSWCNQCRITFKSETA